MIHQVFTELTGLTELFKNILDEHEIVIKNVSESDTQLYARKIIYKEFGKSEIQDRMIPYKLIIENINGKKKVSLING